MLLVFRHYEGNWQNSYLTFLTEHLSEASLPLLFLEDICTVILQTLANWLSDTFLTPKMGTCEKQQKQTSCQELSQFKGWNPLSIGSKICYVWPKIQKTDVFGEWLKSLQIFEQDFIVQTQSSSDKTLKGMQKPPLRWSVFWWNTDNIKVLSDP